MLSGDALAASQTVTPEELKSYYESNIARFRTDEQRRASHILIAAPKDGKDADRKAAKDKATKLLEDLRKHPETFADVAKKQSQDPGSAEKGGDLGFMGRGALVKPFEDAMYALKDGQISDVVETDYGYHIIKLTGIKPAETQPLEAVRPELEAELKSSWRARSTRSICRCLRQHRLRTGRQPQAGRRQVQADDSDRRQCDPHAESGAGRAEPAQQ